LKWLSSYTGGWIPYGYRRVHGGTIAVVPEEAVVVERIFRWAADGGSLPEIAKALREEKAPTRNGGTWRPSTIQGMLRNRFYAGRVEFDGALIRARHDAIVSDEVFARCSARD
jgi:site-specific DNA recombinase